METELSFEARTRRLEGSMNSSWRGAALMHEMLKSLRTLVRRSPWCPRLFRFRFDER